MNNKWRRFSDRYGVILTGGFIGLLTGYRYGDRLEITLVGLLLGLGIGTLLDWVLNRFYWLRIVVLSLFIGLLTNNILESFLKPIFSITTAIVVAFLAMIMLHRHSPENREAEEKKSSNVFDDNGV